MCFQSTVEEEETTSESNANANAAAEGTGGGGHPCELVSVPRCRTLYASVWKIEGAQLCTHLEGERFNRKWRIAPRSRLDNLRQQADELRQKMKLSGASMRPQSASRADAQPRKRPPCSDPLRFGGRRRDPDRPRDAHASQPRLRGNSAARKRRLRVPVTASTRTGWLLSKENI